MGHEKITIPVGGKRVDAVLREVDIGKLKYDEFNPRISLARDSHMGALYKDTFPQSQLELALKGSASFYELKMSILKGGGAMNPLWVYPEKNYFVVIEGNTRLAVYREILKEESTNLVFEKVNCYVLPYKIPEEVKNFIRVTAHLHGQEDWDKYEQAKYLYVLYEKQDYPISMLADMTKLKRDDIEQDIEAYKIMNDQFYPKYGKYDRSFVHRFSYFKEYTKDRKLKKVMENLKMDSKKFCDWVGSGKFVRAQDVRKLRDILSEKKTREVFIKKDLEQALEELRNIKPEKSSKILKLVYELKDCIKNLKVAEIDELRSDRRKSKMIKEICDDLGDLVRRK